MSVEYSSTQYEARQSTRSVEISIRTPLLIVDVASVFVSLRLEMWNAIESTFVRTLEIVHVVVIMIQVTFIHDALQNNK